MTESRPAADRGFWKTHGSTAKIVLVALGLTSIDLLWVIKPAVEPSQHALFHWSGAPLTLFVPIALDVLAVWLLIAALMLAARKPGRLRVFLWTGLLLSIPWFLLLTTEVLSLTAQHNHLARATFLVALAMTAYLTAVWSPSIQHRFGRTFDRIVAASSMVLFFAGVFGMFLLCRLAWYGFQAGKFASNFPLHQAARFPNTPQPHRVIWIVFDELSYSQVYEHRYPGLELPAFDQLASQSTVFTHVEPIGIYTEIVLPGLLSGKPPDDIQTSPKGELFVHSETTGKWSAFDQHDTVFQDALDAGYGTGVAGWYNPYCRILYHVVDRCTWTHRFQILNGMVPSGRILANALEPIKIIATKVLAVGPHRLQVSLYPLLHLTKESVTSARLHIQDYQSLDADADKLLRDRSAGFVLLHLPVPHPIGIYDRRTGRFTTAGSTYLDNLALADKCLAGLRATLEQTGQWNSSTVVVMGDHSWRTTQLWKSAHEWTATEQAASLGGTYDGRPVYLVKLPGQTTAGRVDMPFRAVHTRTLFDAVLRHAVQTPEELSSWAGSVR